MCYFNCFKQCIVRPRLLTILTRLFCQFVGYHSDVQFCNYFAKEKMLYFCCVCSLSPPRDAIGWSLVCIYGISRLYLLVLKLEFRICDHVLMDLLNLTFENDKKNLSKIVSEYDQEIPQSQTADNPVRKSRSTITRHQEDKLSKAISSLFPIKMIAILEWT